VSGTEDALGRAEELLDRLEQARGRLEAVEDPEAAIDILGELAELARQVEAELERARRDAGSAGS
jgi:exonuclease VII small subunit